ncbi:hypothetical protein V495_01363 [Pseudogymnoascus sp. VKM F-4514 (FW-929)]|nr:hypothetical protein V495_01363 [Pseudogymnoascus sp. VKM F-4514 (FW-929)]KFY67533.1 hypothetical protein V497_00312 [Pseudogymnoascus sp. VKM F-4516 (FW-969)]
MPGTEPYSSPFILDLDVSEDPDDQDFEFFNPGTPYIASGSPGPFLEQNLPSGERRANFGSPAIAQKGSAGKRSSAVAAGPRTPSTPSLDSPGGSFHDSSSDSSTYNKRKPSSESSEPTFEAKDASMNDAEMGDWKVEGGHGPDDAEAYGPYSATTDSSSTATAFDFNDKIMENDFDFDSAASSPSHFASAMKSPGMPTIKHDTPSRNTPVLKHRAAGHHSKSSQNSITHTMNGLTTNASREASPLSTMITSQGSSPSVYFNNSPSPTGGVEFINGTMLGNGPQSNPWQTNYDFSIPNSMVNGGFMPMRLNNNIPQQMPFSAGMPLMDNMYKPVLTIHPTPLKSRVETQIPIKMTLFPFPPGVTKLHLPTHTISKPKLLAKEALVKGPDTLELTTTLVCTSAMQNPEFRRRAFERAAGATKTSDSRSEEEADSVADDDDENKPLNGGEVKICSGCITRERKRAARKKVKKVEEEESWHKDEDKRVIVFNTHEIKDWQQPSSQVMSETVGDRREPVVHEGALQVDAPMRIACYCRHQNEKLGFQVIFTIKDWTGRLVAQEITSSIMITDDHKTHNMPHLMGSAGAGVNEHGFLNGAGVCGPEMGFDMPMASFRASQSSNDAQGLQRNYPLSYAPSSTLGTPQASQNAPSTTTPRSLSRQASPSGSIGPSNKKRKASGSSKVPSGLAMTRLENMPQHPGGLNPAANGSGNGSSQPPYGASPNMFASPQDTTFNHMPQSVQPGHTQFNAGSPNQNGNEQGFISNNNRSQSMDNLALNQLYSAPTSTHPSRAPSPNSMRNSIQAYQQQQAQIAQAVANGLYGMPLPLNPHRPPTIHKMIPNEGPKAGGIEVTCLGSGFCQGLEVMFGDVKATTTTYWGETSLVCLLPPATTGGTVAVTFKHQHQQQLQPFPSPPILKQQAFFKYVDDDEQQIIRTALSVLGHKMTGRMEDVRDLARRIVGDGPSSWGAAGGAGASPTGGSQQPPVSRFNAAIFGVDVEATLLRILDLIDLDDSSHLPRLNMRRASGQTMLHLACSLGLQRFVAALLARGANPEPRDKGGFTPMHFAAMHNHPQIIRRLILCGADPSWRTLQGYTASDLCTNDETLQSTRRVERHSRRRSGGSIRSRTSSATSLQSLWETRPNGAEVKASPGVSDDADDTSETEEPEYSDEEGDEATPDEVFWMHPRRRSAAPPGLDSSLPDEANNLPVPTADAVGAGFVSPAAAMTAFRDHLTAQIQHIQQSMQHLNLPQIPNLPNLPDYQAYLPTAPMVRRISSLVPHMGASRNADVGPGTKEADSRWWDLFSGTMPNSPPAYEDIFPHKEIDKKRASATQAAADAIADDKCSTLYDQAESSSSSVASSSKTTAELLENLDTGSKHSISQEGHAQLRLAHGKKIRFRSDRKLFFIWIPILVIIVATMLYNRLPKVWAEGSQLIGSYVRRRAERAVEVL